MIKRNGFTLVELLIVIVVIGILSGMMMLASTEIQATANVSKVINDLNTMKRAVLMCCADNPDKYPNPPYCKPPTIAEVKKYLNNSEIISDNGTDTSVASSEWSIEYQDKNKPFVWYVHYKMPQHMTDSYSFRKKLAARAKDLRLFFSNEADPDKAIKENTGLYNADKGNSNTSPVNVWMIVFKEKKY